MVYDFAEIVHRLQSRVEDVAHKYAPGGHVEGGKYWALDPGRGDSSIGSFHVNFTGRYAGRWYDHSVNEGGDMLDLIRRAINGDQREALDEAKAFLGLADETPAQRELRNRQAQKAAKEAERQAEIARAKVADTRRRAHGLFLRSHERIAGTPVADYLAGRAIGLEMLGRTPHSIRYHPNLRYYHMDKDTGEVFEGEYPAMVAAIYGPVIEGRAAEFYGVHRTYLQRHPDGRVTKADVPKAKKIFGTKKGGFIRLWTGMGPRGGKGAAMARAQAGARVLISEGIEDALSAAVIDPGHYVIAACDLGNMAEVQLTDRFQHVTLIADKESPDPETAAKQRAVFDKAIRRFQSEGRFVDVWRNHWGGKDLNDALQLAAQEGRDIAS